MDWIAEHGLKALLGFIVVLEQVLAWSDKTKANSTLQLIMNIAKSIANLFKKKDDSNSVNK